MCCLFGLLDFNKSLGSFAKIRLLSALATEAEARGTHATGVAYLNRKKEIVIEKKPIRGSEFNWFSMAFANPQIVMGHTRYATQGNVADNYNNHPFCGCVGGQKFALAHNGVISNDKALRDELSITESYIKTDSYIGVQLLEKFGKNICTDSLKEMGEKIKGTFNFTILDSNNGLWIVKGNNPLVIAKFSNGVVLYASTKKILLDAIKKSNVKLGKYTLLDYENKGDGTIMHISKNGIECSMFNVCVLPYSMYDTYITEVETHFGDEIYAELYLERLAHIMGYDVEVVYGLIYDGLDYDEIEAELIKGDSKLIQNILKHMEDYSESEI